MRCLYLEVGKSSRLMSAALLTLACGTNALSGDTLVGDAGAGGAAPNASGGGANVSGHPSSGAPATGGSSETGGQPANGGATGGAKTSDGAPGAGGGTSDGSGGGGDTGDGKGGGDTGDGKGGGDTGDGRGGGDTGDGRGGGDTGDGKGGGDTGDGTGGGDTGDGCTPVCFPSVLDNVNVIVLNDATADGADVEGRMYVAHDAYFPSYSIGTRMTPDPARADLVVGNDLYFGGGSVPNGKVSLAGTLELGAASTLGGYHQESIVDFAKVEQEMTLDSARLAALPPNGTVSTGIQVAFTGVDPVLNVFEVPAEALEPMRSMTLSAPASSTVLVNVRGTSVSLHDFGFALVGVTREHVLYNLPEATSLEMSGVGIQGSLLAPYADLVFANGNIDGQLVVRNFSGSGESHPKYFVGCLPLCAP